MKAQNLSICVPYSGCDKGCPYCVSKMTGYTKSNWPLMVRNIPKVKQLAKSAQVSNVLITGKGEPTLSMDYALRMIEEFSEFPLELQTNGLRLSKWIGGVDELHKKGLDVLALSVDSPSLDKYEWMLMNAHDMGLTIRITVNICNDTIFDPYAWMSKCKHYNIDQLSFRKITVPNHIILDDTGKKCAEWIEKNIDPQKEERFFTTLKERLESQGRVIRRLPYGATLFDIDGISITWFDYCIQDQSNCDDIRSLIFQEDGHLYTTWNSNASRIL